LKENFLANVETSKTSNAIYARVNTLVVSASGNVRRILVRGQARRQEMKWGGVFCKKVDLSDKNEIKLNQTLLCNLRF